MNVTVGTLTTSMNNLVKKGYALRRRSEKDRRVVYISLTEKGERAFHHHADFHTQMTDAVIRNLEKDELRVLMKMLNALSVFFRNYQRGNMIGKNSRIILDLFCMYNASVHGVFSCALALYLMIYQNIIVIIFGDDFQVFSCFPSTFP